MKVQVSINDSLLQRADEYCNNNYMTRSAFISFAMTQALNQADTINAINVIADAMKKIAITGTIDEDTKKKLEDFERISKLLTGI